MMLKFNYQRIQIKTIKCHFSSVRLEKFDIWTNSLTKIHNIKILQGLGSPLSVPHSQQREELHAVTHNISSNR